jgi:hypothetical protein
MKDTTVLIPGIEHSDQPLELAIALTVFSNLEVGTVTITRLQLNGLAEVMSGLAEVFTSLQPNRVSPEDFHGRAL